MKDDAGHHQYYLVHQIVFIVADMQGTKAHLYSLSNPLSRVTGKSPAISPTV